MKKFARAIFGLVALVAAAQAGAQLLKPLPGTRLEAQQLAKPSQNPAPVAVQVSGTPTTAVVSWTAPTQTLMQASLLPPPATMAQPARSVKPGSAPAQTPTVLVERLVPNGAPLRLALATPDAIQAYDPGPLTPGRAVTYRVTLSNASGATGAREASFTPPLPRDPAGVSATVAADGSVIVGWQEVPGVLSYQVTGVALPAPVIVNRATEWRSAKLPPGARQWKVASVYEPGGVLTAASAWPSVTSHTLPKPGRPFLTLPAGVGTTAEIQDHYQKQCPPEGTVYTKDMHPICARDSASELLSWSIGGGMYPKAGPGRMWPGAAFADTHDLGVGRRVSCWKFTNSESRLCWATNHGEVPGSGAVADGARLAEQAERYTRPSTIQYILLRPEGAYFSAAIGGLGRPADSTLSLINESMDLGRARAATTTTVDSQGTKAVPHACMSCHGGRYDPTTRAVVGASLLPLVPAHLGFSSPQTRASSEEDIRRINQFVLESNPAPAIAAQITTLYNGAPFTPGTRANDNAVPPGWAQQPGLYRQVVAPYCGSCHFAQTGPLSFASFGNLVQHKAAVQRTVCTDFTMPHSEVAFRRFWTDGGAVSLPGLLSTVLGYPSCAQ